MGPATRNAVPGRIIVNRPLKGPGTGAAAAYFGYFVSRLHKPSVGSAGWGTKWLKETKPSASVFSSIHSHGSASPMTSNAPRPIVFFFPNPLAASDCSKAETRSIELFVRTYKTRCLEDGSA